MKPEIWKAVCGYEGLYEVSNLGRVKSQTNGKFIQGCLHRSGALKVTLCNNGRKTVLVHRLVATAFLGPQPPGMECAHNDGNPQNNQLSNLRWDTHFRNMQDKRKHGTNYQPKGELHPNRRLSIKMVWEIIKSKATQMEIAAQLNIHQSTVSDVLTGRTWSHITGINYEGNKL